AIADFLRVLPADEPKRHLGACLARDHGFRAFARIAANDAVDLGRWARSDLLDQHTVLLARRLLEADPAEKFLGREFEPLQVRLYGRRQLFYAFVEAGNSHPPVFVVERTENSREHAQWVLRRPAENAGVQIAIRAGNPYLLINEPAERGGNRRRP